RRAAKHLDSPATASPETVVAPRSIRRRFACPTRNLVTGRFPEADREDQAVRPPRENDRNPVSGDKRPWLWRRTRPEPTGVRLAFRPYSPALAVPPSPGPNDYRYSDWEHLLPTCSNSNRGRQPDRG